MKTKVTFSCGHEGVIEALGNEKQREDKIRWAEERGLCKECFIKQKESEPLNVDFTSDEEGNCFFVFGGGTYARKEEIKKTGARWDGEKKRWVIMLANDTGEGFDWRAAEFACKEVDALGDWVDKTGKVGDLMAEIARRQGGLNNE